MTLSEALGVFNTFKQAFEAEPCDVNKCQSLLAQLKILIVGFKSSATLTTGAGDDETTKERLLARETLELACFLSIRARDLAGFERHVTQLKTYYYDYNKLTASKHQHPIVGLYLLFLLAADRIGDFHTELELLTNEDCENMYIKQPISLERNIMEGNYAKIMEAKKDVPQMYYPFFMEQLMETVRQKVGASIERSYEKLSTAEATKMLILNNVEELKEFARKENDRKMRESEDDLMLGDTTPSIGRRPNVGLINWEVADGNLRFNKTAEKQLEIPALELMVNTIGYATDLERIV
jgi:26S proteasome regulatory subunit N12